MADKPIVVGNRAAELQAFQLLALALSEQASRLAEISNADATAQAVPALLHAAARACSLATVAGLDTPIEVTALAARNVFELWLRLTHIISSEANRQAWRDEALTDQLQVLEGILTLEGEESKKEVVRGEIDRVKRHGIARGLNPGVRPRMAADLSRDIGEDVEREYRGFYKMYSKLVHPSSWAVNWPDASTSEMYRFALCLNGQVYGWQILETVDRVWRIPAVECYDAARASMAIYFSGASAGTLPNDG
jgi:hypothetical protein